MFVEIIETLESKEKLTTEHWRFLEYWASDIIQDWLPDASFEDKADLCQECLTRLIIALSIYDTNRPFSPFYGAIRSAPARGT